VTEGRVAVARASRKVRTLSDEGSIAPLATAANSVKSLPAENESPSASKSTTWTCGSDSARTSAPASASYIAPVSAFFFSGRASVNRSTWSSRRMRTADMAACSWLVRRMQCRLQRNAPKKRYGRTVLNRRPHQLSTLQLDVRSGGLARSRELTQDVMQDAPVLEVLALLGRVDANTRLELDRRTGLGRGD